MVGLVRSMCEFLSWCDLTSSEQAAWVQAIGSIVAILVAVAVPTMMGWYQSKAKRRFRRERKLNALLQILDPLSSLRVSLDEFYETSASDYDENNPVVSIDPNQGDFQSLLPSMIASVSLLNDMDEFAPLMRNFLFQLIELDRYLKLIPAVERSGSPAFLRNNLEEIRAMIKGVIDQADVVLKKIENSIQSNR